MQRGIPFTDRNIAADQEAMAELQAMNLFTTPVLRIGDEIVVGFDRAKIDRALGLG